MLGVEARAVHWADVGLYLVVAFGLSWGMWVGLRGLLPLAVRTFLAMFGPTFATIAVIRVRRGHHLRHQWRETGPRIVRNLFGSGLALALVTFAIGAGFGLSLATGDLKFPGNGGENLFQVLPLPLAIAIFWITAFGEEYGWRGFLQPTLSPLGGARTVVLTALVFAAWHAPAILLDGFDYPKHHVLGVFDLLVFAVPFTVVQAWLRSATGTVAAPATAHAALNAYAGLLYASTIRTTSIIAAPVGLLGTLPFAVLALMILLTGRLWRRTADSEPGLRTVAAPAIVEERRLTAGMSAPGG